MYGWDSSTFRNNGSLLSQAITTSTGSFTQTYAYDPLKRIQSISDTAAGTALKRNFNYDAFGNNWIGSQSSGLPYNALTPVASAYKANNQLGTAGGTFAYDPSGYGRLTTIGPYALSYDPENRITAVQQNVSGSVSSVNFLYDAAGQRVQKAFSPGASANYIYDALGELAAEYSTGAPASKCTTCYLSWDHLGSIRMVTYSSGNVISRHDFMPFGDEIPGSTTGRSNVWGATDNVSQRYTGQERDETTFDYFDARYFYSGLGRFTSPDPLSIGADLANPQSWNGYAYVLNAPLSAVDPDGMQSSSCSICASDPGSGGNSGAPSGGSFNGGSNGSPGSLSPNPSNFRTGRLPLQYAQSGQIYIPGETPSWFQPGTKEQISAPILGTLDGLTGDSFSEAMERQYLLAPLATWAQNQRSYKAS